MRLIGSGTVRARFGKLLTAMCERNVGALLALKASRLARYGRRWHTLLEFCGLVGALIIDEDGIYEPRLPNDRLLLRMKGTTSEMEADPDLGRFALNDSDQLAFSYGLQDGRSGVAILSQAR